MKTVDVISIGAVNCDIIAFVSKFPEAEEKINSVDYIGPQVAGVALDCISMINNLGLCCGHLGKLGDDEYATIAKQQLVADNIDISRCIQVPDARSSLAWVMVNPQNGERCHIIHPMSADGMITQANVEDANDYLCAARAVHMEMLQMPMEPLCRAAEICREHGVTTSMDIDIAPRYLYEYEYATPDLLKKTCGTIDVLKLCKDAIPDMTRETDIRTAALDILEQYGPTVLIITVGEDGCVVAWQEEGLQCTAVPGFKGDGIVDTTGAGDAFQGGFLYGYLHGYGPEKSAVLGNACGYLKSRNIGARNMPSRKIVETFLQGNGWKSL